MADPKPLNKYLWVFIFFMALNAVFFGAMLSLWR
jgi:hypothetical protein